MVNINFAHWDHGAILQLKPEFVQFVHAYPCIHILIVNLLLLNR